MGNKDSFGIEAFDGNNWIDVSDRKAIIYGAGHGCIDMMIELLLPDVSLVVDGDNNRHGENVMLMSQEYKISSPNILSDIDASRYYIVVSTEKYYEEIRTEIADKYKKSFLVVLWMTDIRFRYKTIETMLIMDNYAKNKVKNTGVGRRLYEIIDNFYALKDTMTPIPIVDRFIPIKGGWSKFSFIFGNSDNLWVFHCAGYVNSKEKRALEREYDKKKIIRENYLEKNNIEKPLLICKKGDAFIQMYGESRLDYNDYGVRNRVYKKMREIHQLPQEDLPRNNIETIFFWDFLSRINNDKSISCKCGEQIEKIRIIGEESAAYIEENRDSEKVIHGDLTYENIVAIHSDIFFIDWEFISVGLPEIDICYFLFSLNFTKFQKGIIDYITMCNECYKIIPEAINSYYADISEITEHMQLANAVMDLCIIRDIFMCLFWNIDLASSKMNSFITMKQ